MSHPPNRKLGRSVLRNVVLRAGRIVSHSCQSVVFASLRLTDTSELRARELARTRYRSATRYSLSCSLSFRYSQMIGRVPAARQCEPSSVRGVWLVHLRRCSITDSLSLAESPHVVSVHQPATQPQRKNAPRPPVVAASASAHLRPSIHPSGRGESI